MNFVEIKKQLTAELSHIEKKATQIKMLLKTLSMTAPEEAPEPTPRRRYSPRHKISCKQCGRKFIPKRTGKVPMFCHRPCTSWTYNWEQGTTKKQRDAGKKTLREYKKASAKGELLVAGDPLRAAAPVGH
jgi:hypothetical protein